MTVKKPLKKQALKTLEKTEGDTHQCEMLPTDSKNFRKHWFGDSIREASPAFFRTLNRALNKIGKSRQCSVCGGLQPELVFENGSQRFFFTCWKVEKVSRWDKEQISTVTLLETDYERLQRYASSEAEHAKKAQGLA